MHSTGAWPPQACFTTVPWPGSGGSRRRHPRSRIRQSTRPRARPQVTRRWEGLWPSTREASPTVLGTQAAATRPALAPTARPERSLRGTLGSRRDHDSGPDPRRQCGSRRRRARHSRGRSGTSRCDAPGSRLLDSLTLTRDPADLRAHASAANALVGHAQLLAGDGPGPRFLARITSTSGAVVLADRPTPSRWAPLFGRTLRDWVRPILEDTNRARRLIRVAAQEQAVAFAPRGRDSWLPIVPGRRDRLRQARPRRGHRLCYDGGRGGGRGLAGATRVARNLLHPNRVTTV